MIRMHREFRRRRSLALLTAPLLALAFVPGVVIGSASPARALDNGLTATPPMGWNDWNAFGCGVNEQLVEQTADAIVASGMRDAGYQYVNIDDCWALPNRDADGDLVADPAKFPDGIAALADYVHARGLKLGIYEDAGTHTCSKSGGFSGSLGHEQQDAMLFASWHVDYLKYDDCNVPPDGQNAQASIARYIAMRDALAEATARTGQQIVFSICEKGDYGVPNSAWPTIGNLWRTTGDIHDNYSRLMWIFQQNVALADLAGPHHFNDPDMLEIGNGGMTDVEYRTHFTLWAEMAAPLIAGTDLRAMSAQTKAILTNRDVIAVDQDSLGAQARPIASDNGPSDNGHWVLDKPLADGSHAVVLFNQTDVPATISTTARQLGLPSAIDYRLRDLWGHATTESAGIITATLPAHASAIYRVSAALPGPSLAPPHVALGLAGLDDAIASGVPTTVTATVTNDGLLPLLWGRLAVQWPAGWTATPAWPAFLPIVAPGKSATVLYQVTAPTPARPLPDEQVSATLTYHGLPGTTAGADFTQDVRRPTPVQPPYRVFANVDGSTTPRFGQVGTALAIEAAGSDVSGTNNQYGTIYLPGAATATSVITTRITAQQALNAATKSGLIVRDDLTLAGTSPGYVTLAATPGRGFQMQWDADGNGELDSSVSATPAGAGTTPAWLRLVRDGTSFTGLYSLDGVTWTVVGTATVPSATGTEDAGVFTTAHNKYANARADFASLDVAAGAS